MTSVEYYLECRITRRFTRRSTRRLLLQDSKLVKTLSLSVEEFCVGALVVYSFLVTCFRLETSGTVPTMGTPNLRCHCPVKGFLRFIGVGTPLKWWG